MEALKLLLPTVKYGDQVMDFRRECLAVGSRMDGCGGLREAESAREWLEENARYADPATLPGDWVLTTQFICVRQSDDRLVGMIQVRHILNDYLARYGGHIGYSIRPSERRKGYAKEQLGLCLDWCREEQGMDRVLILCENEASSKTVRANGGVYYGKAQEPETGETLERYWISL